MDEVEKLKKRLEEVLRGREDDKRRLEEAEARALSEQRRREDEQRRREDAEARALSEQRGREEEQRRREEEQRRREEEQRRRADAEVNALSEQRRRKEEQHRREEAERLVLENRRDTAAALAAVQQEKEERARIQLGQTLDGYLADIHRLNFLMSHLLPPAKPKPTVSSGKKSKSTTSGQTNIHKKYYPLRMRAWPDFLDVSRSAFARVKAALTTQRSFPSVSAMKFLEELLQERFPEEFLDSESFLNEMRTSSFLHETLQMPAQRIMNAYLGAIGHKKKIYFDDCTLGWQSQASADSANNTKSADTEESSEGGTTNTPKPPNNKTRPDCVVLCANVLPLPTDVAVGESDDNDDDDDIHRVYRVTVGEHKALHRLRSAAVSRYLASPVDEDFMVQLARSATSGSAQEIIAGGATQDASREATQEVSSRPPKSLPGQVFFARALTQTFHYMVTSGIEFGYMATGETLSFLRVLPDDPTALLYHTAVFPEYTRRIRDNQDVAGEANGIDRLAVSMLCGLCLLAYESMPESTRQRSINISQLALFPELPPSLTRDTSSPTSSPTPSSQSRDGSSQGRRRRRDDGDDGDDERESGEHAGGGDNSAERGRLHVPAHRPRRSSPLKRQRSASNQSNEQEKTRRKRRRVGPCKRSSNKRSLTPLLPHRFDPSSFRPIRPYCTQACLLSFVREEGVDFRCPNVTLHLQALRRTAGGLQRQAAHAITRAELCERVRQQLLDNAEQDCACLLRQGLSGAIGCLFKITLTGFGYTFVAKGVQSWHRRRLRHEVEVYEQLAPQQGLLIPVCLGLIGLLLPYPMENCTLVTDMLLMSYAGLPLYSSRLRKLREKQQGGIDPDLDLEEASERTMQELEAVGLEERDEESNGNLTWCEETGRVMKIDFDHAHIRRRNGLLLHVSEAKEKERGGLEVARPSSSSSQEKGRWKSNGRTWGGSEQQFSIVDSLLLA